MTDKFKWILSWAICCVHESFMCHFQSVCINLLYKYIFDWVWVACACAYFDAEMRFSFFSLLFFERLPSNKSNKTEETWKDNRFCVYDRIIVHMGKKYYRLLFVVCFWCKLWSWCWIASNFGQFECETIIQFETMGKYSDLILTKVQSSQLNNEKNNNCNLLLAWTLFVRPSNYFDFVYKMANNSGENWKHCIYIGICICSQIPQENVCIRFHGELRKQPHNALIIAQNHCVECCE